MNTLAEYVFLDVSITYCNRIANYLGFIIFSAIISSHLL